MQKFKTIIFFALLGIISLLSFVFVPSLISKWARGFLVQNPDPISSVIPTSQWKKYTSEDGKFSIWFPGNPELTNVTDNISGIDLTMPTFFVWADRQTEYCASYCDYPKSTIKNFNKFKPEQQFDIFQSGIAQDLGKIVYQKDITIEGYPGRELEFVAGGKANFSGRVRLVLVSGRLYQLIVIFLTTNPHSADRDIFFNSFRFKN